MGIRGSSLNGCVRIHPNNNYNEGDSVSAHPHYLGGSPNGDSTQVVKLGGSTAGGSSTDNTSSIPTNRESVSPGFPTKLPGGAVDHASDESAAGVNEENGVEGTTPAVHRRRRSSLIRKSSSRLLNYWRRSSKRAREVFGYSSEESGRNFSSSLSNRSISPRSGSGRRNSCFGSSEMDYRRPASRGTSVGSDGDQHSFRMKRQPSTYGELHELVAREKLGDGVVRGLVGELPQGIIVQACYFAVRCSTSARYRCSWQNISHVQWCNGCSPIYSDSGIVDQTFRQPGE